MRAWLQFPGSFSPIKDKTRRHQLHQRECRRNKIARKPRKAGRFKSAEIVSVKFHLPTRPINAAYQSAIATIAAHEATILQPADHQVFFDALDNPPTPADSLKDAFKRHGGTVDSK
jgi:hypothetical protein